MDLIIGNKVIEAPIPEILYRVRAETGYKYFSQIGDDSGKDVMITCPYHKDGNEARPSAGVFNRTDDPDVEYGFFKCFTCGEAGPLYKMVAHCFGKDEEFARRWLADNFGSVIGSSNIFTPIDISKKKEKKQNSYLSESELNSFNYIHPYMYQRKLNNDVIAKYKIGYDQKTNSITFPCWDINGNLVAITRRSVGKKNFLLESGKTKEVYLLNFSVKEGGVVYVCESQINALTLRTYGLNSVAFFGTGCSHQYDILNRTELNSFILCLDPDIAGRQGTLRFIKNIKKNAIIQIKDLPDGKDVNDLTKEEFYSAPILSVNEWCKKYRMKIS